jgi:stage III sporulation protein AG
VIVVAEGADDIGVKLNLLRAVETVLNVSPDRVDVYKMNNE